MLSWWMKWAAAPASTCVHAFQNTATVTASTFQSHCRLQKKVHRQNWKVYLGAGAQRAQKNAPLAANNLNTGQKKRQKKRQKLGTFTMKPSMRKDDEKTSPATPSSLKLGLFKCIYIHFYLPGHVCTLCSRMYIYISCLGYVTVCSSTRTPNIYIIKARTPTTSVGQLMVQICLKME